MKQSINSFFRIEIPSDQSMIPISLEDVTIHSRSWKVSELRSSWIHSSPFIPEEKEILSQAKDRPFFHLKKIAQQPSLLSKILNLILDEIPSDQAFVFLVDREGEFLLRESSQINHVEDKDVVKSIVRKAIRDKNPVIVNHLRRDFLLKSKSLISSDLKRAVCFPLIIENRAVGAIYLDRKSRHNPFSLENLELLIALSKPINIILRNTLEFKNLKEKASVSTEDDFVGESKAFRHISNLIDRVKDKDTPVFVCGESGTGKELVARAIHFKGKRKKGRFVVVNCGAIPEHLLEAELYGFVKGAFTGAIRNKPGLVEEADGGTFFLDEIGDLSLRLQAKLLRLLQEKEIRRIGENRIRHIDVRIISATNKNIEKEIGRGNFREDLYYRLKIITIEIPPLRKRKDDIRLLLNHFVERYCQEMKRERAYFSPGALELLMAYQWPGNVRELQNEIQRCLIFVEEENLIKEEFLSSKINPDRETYTVSSYNFSQAKAEFERRFLNQALARCSYNKVKTAKEIGLTRQGLFKLMKKHNILSRKENGKAYKWKK